MSDTWENTDGMVIRYGPRLKCDTYPEVPVPETPECPTGVYGQEIKWTVPEGFCLGFGPHEEVSS